MRIIKLLVVTLSVCFFASIIAGCSTNTPAASVEETTATTTAAPTPEPTSTPTPTPTPEPTATPTPIPTPPVKQWKTDKKLLGKWSFSNDTVKIEYQFNKDNTGVVKTTFNIKHMDTNEVETKTSESKFKYSYMGKGDKKKMNGKKIQFSKLIIVYENGNYKEYQYGISGKDLLMLDGAVKTNLKKK